jgi:hypothetical protein
MAILETLLREHVKFDPSNAEHRKAYLMLQYQGRQHPKLRFVLEVPHNSVLFMMQEAMAKAFCGSEIAELGIHADLNDVVVPASEILDFGGVVRNRRVATA